MDDVFCIDFKINLRYTTSPGLSKWQHQNYEINRYDDMIPVLRSLFHLLDEMKVLLKHVLMGKWATSNQLIRLKGSHIG